MKIKLSKNEKIKKAFARLKQRIGRGFGCVKQGCGVGIGRYKALFKAKPLYGVLIIATPLLVLIVATAFMAHGVTIRKNNGSYVNQQETQVAQQMQLAHQKAARVNALQKSLQGIQNEISQSHQLSNEKITQLVNQMERLTNNIDGIKQSEALAKASAANSAKQAQLNMAASLNKVGQVENQLNVIHKQLEPKHYLPSSDLPFEVAGLQYWGSEPMASIVMKDVNGGVHYRLMGVGMQFNCQSTGWKIKSCTNWTLSHISANPSVVIFNNTNGQKVKVTL